MLSTLIKRVKHTKSTTPRPRTKDDMIEAINWYASAAKTGQRRTAGGHLSAR